MRLFLLLAMIVWSPHTLDEVDDLERCPATHHAVCEAAAIDAGARD